MSRMTASNISKCHSLTKYGYLLSPPKNPKYCRVHNVAFSYKRLSLNQQICRKIPLEVFMKVLYLHLNRNHQLINSIIKCFLHYNSIETTQTYNEFVNWPFGRFCEQIENKYTHNGIASKLWRHVEYPKWSCFRRLKDGLQQQRGTEYISLLGFWQ